MTPAIMLSEARAIVRADEALDATFLAREAAGTTLSSEETDAWIALVKRARDRIVAHTARATRAGTGIPEVRSYPGVQLTREAADAILCIQEDLGAVLKALRALRDVLDLNQQVVLVHVLSVVLSSSEGASARPARHIAWASLVEAARMRWEAP